MFAYYLNLRNVVELWFQNEEGQDLIEYAMLVALIVLVAIGTMAAVGTNIAAIWTAIAARLTVPGG